MLGMLLAACTPDVRGLYEAERRDALTVAAARPQDWDADLRVRIAADSFEEAVGVALRAALQDPPGFDLALPLGLTAKVKPRDVVVERARLRPSDACDACLALDAQLAGKAAWSVGGAGANFPFQVSLDGIVELDVAGGTEVRARPRTISDIRVKVGDLEGLRASPSKELQDWIRAELSRSMPPIVLGDLGGADLPVRDLRLRTAPGELVMEALTDVPGAKAAAAGTRPEKGVTVSISETALAGLARRAAFEQGVLAMDVAADPRALRVDGDAFTMDLRLWRLVGRGWWRDYEVKGSLAVVAGQLRLQPASVTEVASSPGATLVDPLAALVQAKVIEAIQDAVHTTLPASRSENLGAVRLRAAAKRVRGADGTLFLDGTLQVVPPGKK